MDMHQGFDDKVTKAILHKDLDHTYKDMYGYTHLMRAAELGYFDVVMDSVNNGANIEEKDKFGITALYMALAQGHEAIAIYLFEKKANPNVSPSETYNPTRRLGMNKIQLEAGTTPLMLSIMRGYKDLAKKNGRTWCRY